MQRILDYVQTDASAVRTVGTVAGGLVSLYLLTRWYRRKSSYTFPSGPPGSLFMGNANEFANNWPRLHKYLSECSEKYGDVFTLDLVGTKLICVSSSETIHEVAVRSNTLNDRPTFYRIDYMLDFEEDITFGKYSPKWVNMKKTALTSMKTYSDGLKRVEALSHQILSDLIDALAAHKGEPFSCRDVVKSAICNFMSWLTYGEGMPMNELNEFKQHSQLLTDVFTDKGIGPLIDRIPLLRFIPCDTTRKMREFKLLSKKIFGSRLRKGIERHDPNDVKCSLDVMLIQQKDTKLTNRCLDMVTRDMMAAGVETTTSSLLFFMALAANHPGIQAHAQKCVDDAIGDRLPLISDKAALPYIEAMTLEVLRLLTPAAVFSRCAQCDTDILGYHVPKGTMFFINLWKMHHDEKNWDAPYEFRPERFLGEDGKTIPPDHPNRKNFLPFGAGRRVCIGEVLARNRLFLFVTALLQHFTFAPESAENPPDCNPRNLELGLFLELKNYKIRAIPREK